MDADVALTERPTTNVDRGLRNARNDPLSAPRAAALSLSPPVGGLFGALTGCLGGGMVWTTTASPSLPTALTLVSAVVVLASVGWFGTEHLVRASAGEAWPPK